MLYGVFREEIDSEASIKNTGVMGVKMNSQKDYHTPKLRIELDVNNIGPHYGDRSLKFPADLDSNKVIIYATNGTGKSFISRTFRLTAPEKAGCSIDNLLTLGQDSAELSLCIACLDPSIAAKRLFVSLKRKASAIVKNDTGLIFHVFNSDYVEDNIRSKGYTPDGNIEGYILGKVQIDLSEEKKREKEIADDIKSKGRKIDDIIENARAELKEEGVKANTKEFELIEKDRLRMNETIKGIQAFDEIVKQLKTLANMPESIPDIIIPAISVNSEIFDQLETLLTTSFPKSEWDEEFVKGIKEHWDFIKHGLESFDDDAHKCPFCKQHIADAAHDLIQQYKAYFAGKEAAVLKQIADGISTIEVIINSIKKFEQDTKTADSGIASLRQYLPSLDQIVLEIPDLSDAIGCLVKIKDDLKKKSEDTSYVDFDIKDVIVRCKKLISRIVRIQNSNAIRISSGNNKKDSSAEERLILRKSLCKAQYLRTANALADGFKELSNRESELAELQKNISEKEQQARISKKDEVYKTLKFFLNRFFADKYAIDKDTFHIKFLGTSLDGQKTSSVLSDGEKSIVAFCVYLASTHLLINNVDDYNKLFFIIDDPVSSMDFNYVYGVAQSLKEIRKYFGITSHDRMWVFTHNLEFLSIITRNHIIDQTFVMRPGKVEAFKSQLLMPYENHLRDIASIAAGDEEPSHTTGNSIRHVIETVCKFENPEKSLDKYIAENEALCGDSYISTMCQDLSHGNCREQPPYDPDGLISACKVVMTFMKKEYPGQVAVIKSKATNGAA